MSDSATHRAINAICDEAVRLGRILAELVPKEPKVHGLVTLMEIQASRARVDGDLLAKLGRSDEARMEFERAATLTRNAREREFLMKRAEACALRSSAAQ